jgi:hypothetical protein
MHWRKEGEVEKEEGQLVVKKLKHQAQSGGLNKHMAYTWKESID